MAKIFIAYSSDDRSQVDQIVGYLRLYGHDPVMDQYDFRGGHDLTATIKAQIASSHFFCPVLTPKAVASPWILQIEVPYALSRKLRVIPILLQDCNIPLKLRGVRHVDFTRDWNSGLIVLLRALPKAQYDEIENLRKAFAALRLGSSNETVLTWLEHISRITQDWSSIPAKEVMRHLEELRATKRRLNAVYWWLMVHGVFRFKGIEAEEMCNAEEDWRVSISCALLTERGVALLNDLHLDSVTHDSIKTMSSGETEPDPLDERN